MSEGNIALSNTAKAKAQALLSNALQAQGNFQMYIQGCKDTLELEGDWNLNTQTWEFEPMKKKDEPVNKVVPVKKESE